MSSAATVWSVNGLTLDLGAGLLRRNGQAIAIRPKSFALLSFLATNSGRVIGKDELIRAVWGDFAITDDALTQTVKDVRRALDDGEASVLRTVPKRGYMLVAEPLTDAAAVDGAESLRPGLLEALVRESVSARPSAFRDGGSAAAAQEPPPDPGRRMRLSGRDRPAIAVLPFAVAASSPRQLFDLRDGLVRDIVRDLARHRTLFVIAANSVQALEGSGLSSVETGRLLRCDYVCSGVISETRGAPQFDVELVAMEGGQALFSERFSRPLDVASEIGAELAGEIARQISDEVDLAERRIAALRQPRDLDAWQAYHRGLWHMYKFTQADNGLAADFFKLSIERDPTFSRPYSGLSFTHWLKGYLLNPAEHNPEAEMAYDLAARGVSVDPNDPAAHCALGRAFWMKGAIEEAVESLERATKLSPNYAFGHYARGFVEALSGNAPVGIEASDRARELSPFDPFLAPMQASRAIGMIRLGQFDEAAAWGARAARQPNAHAHVLRIAAISLTAAGRSDEAALLVRRVNADSPANGGEAFIKGNRMPRSDETLFRELARQSGLI